MHHQAMEVMLAYLLAGYGRRYGFSPEQHPATQAQVRLIREKFAAATPDVEIVWIFDYARRVRTLDDLPILKAVLEVVRQEGKGAIAVADMTLIFRKAAPEDRQGLLCEIGVYDEHIVDISRGGRRMSALPKEEVHAIWTYGITGMPKRQSRTASSNTTTIKKAARKANKVSATSRGRRADALAKKLAQIRDKLAADGENCSMTAIANEANGAGLRTTRGKDWTASAVGRALRRLEKENPLEGSC
jgi:hypothetical protein